MPNAVLVDVTPENVGAQLIGAGVRPGERVTVIVRRRSGAALDRPGTPPAKGGEPSRMEKLRALKGSGARRHGPLSAEEIEADVREFRGDE
ncbi:hypothetical protein JHL17_16550 [Azospirillum sp. YIM B02556]|uniref:Uncharacterized protein n=1 Tax=Azospirillum endophyticum TaxID=2800326 RepID=A0ABS1F6N0_9PROT|nr:hypothetical protein [Azospirillum endophyticum]MBK1839023.1 hypothetical protein [Azospirillum endophyticum]